MNDDGIVFCWIFFQLKTQTHSKIKTQKYKNTKSMKIINLYRYLFQSVTKMIFLTYFEWTLHSKQHKNIHTYKISKVILTGVGLGRSGTGVCSSWGVVCGGVASCRLVKGSVTTASIVGLDSTFTGQSTK